MNLELDHLFVMTSPDGPEADRLGSLSLTEGRGRRHIGQGTVNRCFFFRNSMLEFLWIDDTEAVRSERTRRTRLWERWSGRESGASPFGVCFRPSQGSSPAAPFPACPYRPPYLPERRHISVARDTPLSEPMWFHVGFGQRPDAATPDTRQPLEHPSRLTELTGVVVTGPDLGRLSDAARMLVEAGVLTLAFGKQHLLELEFDAHRQSRQADLRPGLPLILRW